MDVIERNGALYRAGVNVGQVQVAVAAVAVPLAAVGAALAATATFALDGTHYPPHGEKQRRREYNAYKDGLPHNLLSLRL
jgi:hypothetical protein